VAQEDDGARKDVVKVAIWISVWLALVLAGCGSDDPTSADDASPATAAVTAEQPPGSVDNAEIVGRWERVHKCSELVDGLDAAGLREVAAPIVAGDYFADMNGAVLAEKDDLCEGAKPPFVHSHFFDSEGRFGSLDENESQVDEGRYEVIDNQTIRIGGDRGVDFHYEIDGNKLKLSPVLTEAMVEEALANPLAITDATRAIAVAYPGQEWKRVSCKSWC
jgi:hypothetical protein